MRKRHNVYLYKHTVLTNRIKKEYNETRKEEYNETRKEG